VLSPAPLPPRYARSPFPASAGKDVFQIQFFHLNQSSGISAVITIRPSPH
jgi:hypothetical protein